MYLAQLEMGQTYEDTQALFQQFREEHGQNVTDGNVVDYLVINNYLALAAKEFKYIVPIKVTGATNLNLYAIWAIQNKSRQKAYIGQIWNVLKYYKSQLNSPSILIGDWNSNAIWDSMRKNGNHSHVTVLLSEFEISSVYHNLNQIEHGKEIDPTLFLLKNRDKPYHIDYCFASNYMIKDKTTIQNGVYEDWIKISDHMPVIIDKLAVENTQDNIA